MAGALRRQQIVSAVLVAAGIALGVYYAATSHVVTTRESEARKSSLVRVYRSDDLTEIAIERDGRKFRLHRKTPTPDAGDERLWRVEEDGKDGLADQFAVDKALSALEYGFPVRRVEASEVNRAAFGLAAPRFRATLAMGKLHTTIALGGPAPKPEGTIYADVDGEVSVVKKDGLSAVDAPADGFRTRSVVPYLSTDLAALTITTDGKTSSITRGPGGSWVLSEGGTSRGRVDRFILDRALSSFADLKVDHFLPDPAPSASEVVIGMTPTDGAKPKGELALGGECPGHPEETIVIRKLPTALAACTNRGALEGLRLVPSQLADRRAFNVRDDEVEELTMEEGGKRLELARKGAAFHQRAPIDADVAADLVKALLKALTMTKAEEPPTDTPLDKVRTKITIKPTGDAAAEKPVEVVEVGEPDKAGRVRVRRVQDGKSIVFGREDARAFQLRDAALRSTKIVDLPLEKVRRVTITREDGTHTLERSDAGMWTIAAPKGLPIDLGVANSITETCIHLTADRWVADHDDGSFGLAKPRLSFEVVVKDGDGTKTHHVDLGDPTALGVYGRVAGQEGVFLVPRAVETQLLAWAIDLSATTVDPSDVTSITLTRKGAPPITLVATKDGFKPESGELPAARLTALRDALHELRAEMVAHLGAGKKSEALDAPQIELRGKRPPGAPERELRIVIGAGDALRGSNVYFARRDGVDVVYAIPAGRVRTLLGLL